jgi:hypothetical protein
MRIFVALLMLTACAVDAQAPATTATLAAGADAGSGDLGAIDLGAAQPDAKVACPSASCSCCGKCSEVAGVCIPQTDSDCAGSQLCSSFGLCHFVQDGSESTEGAVSYTGRCRAVGSDCSGSKVCKVKGWCVVQADGTCGPIG